VAPPWSTVAKTPNNSHRANVGAVGGSHIVGSCHAGEALSVGHAHAGCCRSATCEGTESDDHSGCNTASSRLMMELDLDDTGEFVVDEHAGERTSSSHP
jgi:hypothetical protein